VLLTCTNMRNTARRVVIVVGVSAFLACVGVLTWFWWDSRMPETYNAMSFGVADYGGGMPAHQHGTTGLSVAELTGPARAKPDARFMLTAKRARVQLRSGPVLNALTFDGRLPGPELRVSQGDLVEVTLRNEDVSAGVTIHWHGVDVPNAEDGVAGVTQDAVLPGKNYVYRFRANQVGTFWYHTHQASATEVKRGLFGAFVIQPARSPPRRTLDMVALSHTFSGTQTLNGIVGTQHRAVPAGTAVRLRLVNTDSRPQRFTLTGTPFRVAAIDGTDLQGPTLLNGRSLEVAAGGRYDLAFTMPKGAVGLATAGERTTLALSPDGTRDAPAAAVGPDFDPLNYGRAVARPFGPASAFDRSFRMVISRKIGFVDGRPGRHWAINGKLFPDVPMYVVRRGDLVKVTIENSSGALHPMHLHGHHLLVLSRNGVPAGGSPWWADTLDVRDGERYQVAFRADNPGLWMDHCHNLPHAAQGLTMHVAYEGVRTPFEIGAHAHNRPE
jgi:FtsP/CotA-like multicopper oxidase with cupredoxin domain